MREPRGRRAGERVSGILGRSALVLGCVKTEQVKQRLESSSSRWAIGRRKCSVSACAALTSEKLVLEIGLLDALLNGQGHERPIEALHGRSALYGAPSRAEVTIDPPRQD